MVGIIRDMWEGGAPGRFALGVILFSLAMIPVAIWESIVEQEEWDTFAEAHSCKVVGKMNGSVQTGVGYGVTSGGKMGTVMTTTTIPDKTGYICDDGVTYWR